MLSVGLARALLPGMILGLPLLGAWLDGRPLAPYLVFPPRPEAWDAQSFFWPWFIATALGIVGGIAPIVIRVITAGPSSPDGMSARTAFPRWGWGGVGILALAWFLAWSRFPWFAPLQPYTFTLLWLGYIAVVNGLTFQRTGHCRALDRPGQMGLLFPLSTLFWWFFEYLNLFAHNWYYVDVGGHEHTAGIRYFLSASIPFSTVLPAVLSTRDWLASFPRLSAGLDRYPRVPVTSSPYLSWLALLMGGAGLLGLGRWPSYLFPAVWIAPLLLLAAFQALTGRRTLFSPVNAGDWRPLWLSALAALVCGFFWELWNEYSLTRWVYTLPQVHGLTVFEMPLLGYAGYLPFGLICVATVEFFLPDKCSSDLKLTPGLTEGAKKRP